MHVRPADQEQVNISGIRCICGITMPVIAFLTSHVEGTFRCIVVEISHGLFCCSVQTDVEGDMLVKGIGLSCVISHGISRSHIHITLCFIQ